jgi:hypothetical protein
MMLSAQLAGRDKFRLVRQQVEGLRGTVNQHFGSVLVLECTERRSISRWRRKTSKIAQVLLDRGPDRRECR